MSADQDSSAGASASSRKLRPTKALPTERIQFSKQLDILRAYAAGSEYGAKTVSLKIVAGLVKMAESTVSISNAFFGETGFIQRTPTGALPVPDVINYGRAYEWNRETAAHQLAPLVRDTWFGRKIITKLRFHPATESEAVEELAHEASATRDYQKQILVLVDYLEASGIVARDEAGMLTLGPNAAEGHVTPMTGSAPDSSDKPKAGADATAKAPSVSTAFSVPTAGVVQFQVQVKVDMGEFAGWSPDRISSFFSGIAQVLAAKGQIEEGNAAG